MSGVNQVQVEECVKSYLKNLLDRWDKAETYEQKETLMKGIVKVVGSILDIKRSSSSTHKEFFQTRLTFGTMILYRMF